LAVPLPPAEISTAVVRRVSALYTRNLPLYPGATKAVALMSERWPLGLASSSNREVIDLVLELAEMKGAFSATVSSEEVARGKPAPDVYLRAAQLLYLAARRCVAVEDSTNGILAAKAAEMHVVAIPNRQFPPQDDAVSKAEVVLPAISHLTPEAVEAGLRSTSSSGVPELSPSELVDTRDRWGI
jgi:HAD superfamily hydrolase (TIGR01509 family)